MRSSWFTILLGGALLIAACDGDSDPIVAPDVPVAITRFVNAVPDTLATDWRFIDRVSLSPYELALSFRSFSPYQQAAPGSRPLRVFPSTTDITVTQRFFVDEVLNLADGGRYTLVHVGPSRTDSDELLVIEDEIPTVGAGMIAVRAMHFGAGLGPVDIYATAGSGDPLPATPLFANVAERSVTAYALRPVGTFVLRAYAAGTVTPVIATATAPAGAAGSPVENLEPIGGSTMAGSAMSAMLMPRSVAGSMAPQTSAFTTPAFVFAVDRHPR